MEKAELVLTAEPKNEQALIVKAAVFVVKRKAEKSLTLLEGKIDEGVNGADMYLLLSAAISGARAMSPRYGKV